MRVLSRLWLGLLFCARTRLRVLISATLLLGLGYASWSAAWSAARHVGANRAHAAAERAIAEYDFATARDRLQRAAELRPRRAEVWLLAAQTARRDGDLVEAKAHLARYEKLVGLFTPEGRFETQLQSAQQGNFERDINDLIALADAEHPATEQILEALAVGSIHAYRLDRAGFWVYHLLTRFPKNPIGRLIRAQMDDILGKRDRAASGCRELLADFPWHVKARLLLAGLHLRAKNYPEALSEYEEARWRRPGDLAPVLGVARCHEQMGHRDETRALMSELETRFPNQSEALLECAKFATAEGREGDAERLLRRASELAPHDHEIHYQLGLCLERAGKTTEAKIHLDRFKPIETDLLKLDKSLQAIVKSPQDPVPRREAGLICLRNGQADEGLRWLHGALEVAPDDKATHEALAEYFTTKGDARRAQFHSQKAR